MKAGLPPHILEMIQAVFQQHPEITRVQLFGSRAMGNYRPNSDIDLVILGDTNEQLLANLALELDELPLPYLFDVKNSANITHHGLREHIKRFGQDVYVRKIV